VLKQHSRGRRTARSHSNRRSKNWRNIRVPEERKEGKKKTNKVYVGKRLVQYGRVGGENPIAGYLDGHRNKGKAL